MQKTNHPLFGFELQRLIDVVEGFIFLMLTAGIFSFRPALQVEFLAVESDIPRFSITLDVGVSEEQLYSFWVTLAKPND